jgi:hypothetical protein
MITQEVLEALGRGKTIEFKDGKRWRRMKKGDVLDIAALSDDEWRISLINYRFKTREEYVISGMRVEQSTEDANCIVVWNGHLGFLIPDSALGQPIEGVKIKGSSVNQEYIKWCCIEI